MKKKLIIFVMVIITIVICGYAAYNFGVNFVFDKYVINSTLSSLSENGENVIEEEIEESPEEALEKETIPPLNLEKTEEAAGNVFQQQREQEDKQKKRLSKTEIITRVMKNPELTNEMAAMVSYEDKRKVIKIVLSNFTANELADIAKTVSKGMPAGYKSKMIAEARSRLTPEQWQECLNIAYKYIEKIRPYVE